jgi:hypothetical protein
MKSLNVKPQMLGHVHALIGKVYAETGRTSEAIDQLKMGESSDENGSIHYLLGAALPPGRRHQKRICRA